MKKIIAFAIKGGKKVECKTWEQVTNYQNRGWKIELAK